MQPTTLESKVANFKLIARNALRMNLISPRLSRITGLENEIESLKKSVDEINHNTLVNSYEIEHADKNHPDFEKTKKRKEEVVAENSKSIEGYNKAVENVNKEIVEVREGIAKIESGETKVSLDELNEMVDRLIRQDALNQVK